MIVECRNIFKNYSTGKLDVPVLKDVNFSMEEGEYVAIMGPSGSGKSTLMNIIGCLDQPTSGELLIDGQDVSKCSSNEMADVRLYKLGFVFQNFQLLAGQTALQNVELPLTYAHVPRAKRRELAAEALARVGLEDRMNFMPNQLSGGQKQRVGIARALATEPEILLCDEATSALDPQTTESILKLLKRVNQEMGITIMLITHQMQVIQMICDRVAVMEDGRIVEEGNVLDVFGRPQAEVTKRFVRTVINDQIPETFYETIRSENRHYRLEQLKFIGDTVNEPVIANLCRREGLNVNIVGANISPMQGSMMSVFILQLIGETERINEAEAYIDQSGAIRKRLIIDWEKQSVTETA